MTEGDGSTRSLTPASDRGSFASAAGELEVIEGWPETGGAAALVIVLAADLVGAVARAAGAGWEEAGGAIAQASELRRRALRLGHENAEAYGAAREALAAVAAEGAGAVDDARLGELLSRAAEVPLALAETAADASALAALVSEHVDPDRRADAAGAAVLAAGATRAATNLVEINLSVRPDDQRAARARELNELAQAASDRALAACA
jgi:formiminotetrahydrofolate cyclodeaminase